MAFVTDKDAPSWISFFLLFLPLLWSWVLFCTILYSESRLDVLVSIIHIHTNILISTPFSILPPRMTPSCRTVGLSPEKNLFTIFQRSDNHYCKKTFLYDFFWEKGQQELNSHCVILGLCWTFFPRLGSWNEPSLDIFFFRWGQKNEREALKVAWSEKVETVIDDLAYLIKERYQGK